MLNKEQGTQEEEHRKKAIETGQFEALFVLTCVLRRDAGRRFYSCLLFAVEKEQVVHNNFEFPC
jgi:hypothetical protein